MKIEPHEEYKKLSMREQIILKEKMERELIAEGKEDIGRDSTTDPERLHAAEEHFNSEEYN